MKANLELSPRKIAVNINVNVKGQDGTYAHIAVSLGGLEHCPFLAR